MLYDFLYETKPESPYLVWSIVISGLCTIIFSLIWTHLYQKEKSEKTISAIVAGVFSILTVLLIGTFIVDKITTPSPNTKTTELYEIIKTNELLTFQLKRPYNHLYKTKTVEIDDSTKTHYIVFKDDQLYKIPKKDVIVIKP